MHQSGATGRYGARLAACEGAYRDTQNLAVLEIDPAQYPGGVALWGAVPPAYDTTRLPCETGIHVHARGSSDGSKEIDATFDGVLIRSRRDLVDLQQTLITSEVAVNYYLSRFVGQQIRFLRCPRCDEMHLDAGYFAVKPHRRHLCHGCGRYFNDDRKAVSNPIAALHASGLLPAEVLPPVRPSRVLTIRQLDFPAGIQVWASNPALIWTADRPEEEGLHVHAFTAPDNIAIDETYAEVTLDGVRLDEVQVQYAMAQGALQHVANKVIGFRCPRCGSSHFDQGDRALFPHSKHVCDECGEAFTAPGRRRLVVGNPFAETRKALVAMSPTKRDNIGEKR